MGKGGEIRRCEEHGLHNRWLYDGKRWICRLCEELVRPLRPSRRNRSGFVHNQTRKALNMDQPRCEACGMTYPDKRFFDVDHKIPVSMGGTHSLDNLQVLCPNCHRRKTMAEWEV